jgi:hypothetical protein
VVEAICSGIRLAPNVSLDEALHLSHLSPSTQVHDEIDIDRDVDLVATYILSFSWSGELRTVASRTCLTVADPLALSWALTFSTSRDG